MPRYVHTYIHVSRRASSTGHPVKPTQLGFVFQGVCRHRQSGLVDLVLLRYYPIYFMHLRCCGKRRDTDQPFENDHGVNLGSKDESELDLVTVRNLRGLTSSTCYTFHNSEQSLAAFLFCCEGVSGVCNRPSFHVFEQARPSVRSTLMLIG